LYDDNIGHYSGGRSLSTLARAPTARPPQANPQLTLPLLIRQYCHTIRTDNGAGRPANSGRNKGEIMFRHSQSVFAGTVGALLLAGMASAAAVESDDQQEAAVSEVTVTARRVAEDIQKVPISITVLTQDQLHDQNIQSMFDLQRSTPGLELAGNSFVSLGAFMRGVGGVNQYFGGVLASTSNPSIYFDMANVQVLKGPQGTFFGVNNLAGAVLNEPRTPSDKFEGYVSAEVGTYNLTDVQGVLNLPISDKVLLRVGGELRKQDGYISDVTDQVHFGNENRWIGRISLTVRPIDGLQNTTMVNFYSSDETRGERLYYPAILNPNGLANTLFGNAQTFGGLTLPQIFATQAQLGPWKVIGVNGPGLPYSRNRFLLAVNTTEYKLNEHITLKNIGGYNSTDTFGTTDFDGSPVPIVTEGVPPSKRSGPTYTFSDEAQVIANLFDDRLKLLAGSYNDWSGQWGPHNASYDIVLGTTPTGTSTPDPGGDDKGLYFNGNLDLGWLLNGLTLSGGYRYSWMHLRNSSCTYAATGAVIVCPPTQYGSWAAPDYTVGVQYQLLPSTMIYVNNSTGSDSGIFNPVGSPPAYALAQPERLKMIETGVKSNFHVGEMLAQTNFAGWYGWYTNIRTPQSIVGETAAGTPTSIILTTNAAEAVIQGVEGSMLLQPVEPLELTASFSYDSNYFSQYTFEGQDVRKSSLPYMPRWMHTLGGTYHLPIKKILGDISYSVNYSDIGRQSTAVEYPANRLNDVPRYHILDMVLDWRDVWGHEGLSARISATNVLNGKIGSGVNPAYTSLGYVGYTPPLPSMVGLTLRYSF
jgi:iron complex outermembrane receptor protein